VSICRIRTSVDTVFMNANYFSFYFSFLLVIYFQGGNQQGFKDMKKYDS
jgi:hypothetical protein